MKVGTLVMFHPKGRVYYEYPDGRDMSGAVGSVMSAPHMRSDGDIGSNVEFPRFPPPDGSAIWDVPTKFLIPLSDPDSYLGDVFEEDIILSDSA